MTFEIIIQVVLLGVALSMDAFAVSITDGLTYKDINKKKSLFIASVFGFMQAIMPLIGYWLVEIVERLISQGASNNAGNIVSTVVAWIALLLLLFLGFNMAKEGFKELKHPEELKPKFFSVKEVLIFGIATSIDALGTGVALHAGTISNNETIFFHVFIILCCTFIISLIGLCLGNKIEKLFKGKYQISEIIGGFILIILGIWIILSHYLGI